jgi:imidazolonepropionase-like amidohydrolase
MQLPRFANATIGCILALLLFAQIADAAQHVIYAGNALLVPGEAPAGPVTVVTSDGMIMAVETGRLPPEALPLSPDQPVDILDLGNAFLLPGLIDTHVHFSGNYSPRTKLENVEFSSARKTLNAFVYARQTLLAGFTTVRDLGGDAEAIFALRDVIATGAVQGPRIVAAGDMISASGGHADIHGYRRDVNVLLRDPVGLCDGPYDCRRAVREMVHRGADVIKLGVTGGVTSDTAAGIDAQMAADEIAAAIETAHNLGRRVAVHAHGPDGIRMALELGADSIEHGTFIDDEGLALMARSNAYLVPTFSAGRVTRELAAAPDTFLPRSVIDKVETVVPAHLAHFRRALAAGVRVALGSDAGVIPHGANGKELVYLVEAGMTPMAAIEAATTRAAQLLELADEIGTIEPGKAADLVATAASPLDAIEQVLDIRFVMKGGVVARNTLVPAEAGTALGPVAPGQ